jgi:hypothetical protein
MRISWWAFGQLQKHYNAFCPPADAPSLFLRAAHAHSAVPGGKNALECSEMHCLKMHFAHQVQLNAHVQPLKTKMAVGHENDE